MYFSKFELHIFLFLRNVSIAFSTMRFNWCSTIAFSFDFLLQDSKKIFIFILLSLKVNM
jgi:hypothetical protein